MLLTVDLKVMRQSISESLQSRTNIRSMIRTSKEEIETYINASFIKIFIWEKILRNIFLNIFIIYILHHMYLTMNLRHPTPI